jgi:hypothetical protein
MQVCVRVTGTWCLAVLIVMAWNAGAHCQTAADIPLWFDVSDTTPPNIKINTDLTTEVQNEEQVAVNPNNPDNLVAVWRDFRLGYRQVGWGYSFDGGTTWTEGGLVSQTPHPYDSDPGITVSSDGTFYSVMMSWGTGVTGIFAPVSFDGGQSWFAYLTCVEEYTQGVEDKEMITCDVTGGPTDGDLYVAWTHFPEGYDSTQILCVGSTNGTTFSSSVPVSEPGERVQWPMPAVLPDGRVVVAWVSHTRNQILCDVSQSFTEGASFGTDRVIADYGEFTDYINGNIWVFPFPALASDVTDGPYDGRLYCAFTGGSDDGFHDLYMTYSDDAGETWSPLGRINDDPLGNQIDQFHPWITVNPDGVVSVVWYDRRLDPSNFEFDVYIAHSFDGGQTWTPNQRVSNVSSSPAQAAKFVRPDALQKRFDGGLLPGIASPQSGLIGEYIGLATSRLRSTIVFTDTRNGNQDVYAANMPLRLFPPKLTGPEDGLLTNDSQVSFTWDDWSIYDAGLTYVLEYTTDPTFATGVTRLEGLTDHGHEAVLPDGFYYWRVRAFDIYGDSSATGMRTIWVDVTPPDVPVPVPPGPLSGDTITDHTPVFAWTMSAAKDAAIPTPVTYELEVASDPGFTTDLRVYADLATTEFELPDEDSLTYGQTWFWRVAAADSAGNASGYCDPVDFYLALPYILGDLNGDGFIDPLDLAALIDMLFAGAEVPVPPPERADLNCDGFPDPLDLAILIDHLFAGAPAPEC